MKNTLIIFLIFPFCFTSGQVVSGSPEMKGTSGTLNISGVYPHLTAYSQSRLDGKFNVGGHSECGIGAVVPWAGKLWMITYAPHKPGGSQHKLYSIDDDLNMTIHPESVGGTPAGRMIHEESQQLFLGHYAIDKTGNIRVMSPNKMPARVTAYARHISDPANYLYLIDMEDMVYEINVNTLEFKKLFHDPVPGYHAKGGYTSQGYLVISNNGEGKNDDPKCWQVDNVSSGEEDRGCLASWDGKTWKIIERRQYTDVTGPEGIRPSESGKDLPLWSIGWDKRSLRLKLLDSGKWYTFLLPKACLNNDAKHGWFTEWPRIRDIGRDDLLMDMHGMFFDFPRDFSASNSGGISPVGSHLRYIPDFCDWNGRLVLATDEDSIQGNPMCGQPQSNLWFGNYSDLKGWGPASAAGSVWMDDSVKAGIYSEPFLVNGFKRRMVHLASDVPVIVTFQIDKNGDGNWQKYKTIEVDGYACYFFPENFKAQWIRLKTDRDCKASVSFHFTDGTYRHASEGKELFEALAEPGDMDAKGALIFAAKRNRNLQVIALGDKETYYDFGKETFAFTSVEKDDNLKKKLQIVPEFRVDAAAVIIESAGKTLRLPKGDAAYGKPFESGFPRGHREVESERVLTNLHGTIYEVPLWIVGEPPLYYKMRPVTTHNKQIVDYATWNGLLVLSGLKADVQNSSHVYKSEDGTTALWFGGIDDLWKLGKPVGTGGPWKDTFVAADMPSDPYLMTGYDKKSLELLADKDVTVRLEIDFDYNTGWHNYKTFRLKAGKKLKYKFPVSFSAHWVRLTANADCTATAWFTYY